MADPGVGTNRFAYAANDPINRHDPTGNEWDRTASAQHQLDMVNKRSGGAYSNLGVTDGEAGAAQWSNLTKGTNISYTHHGNGVLTRNDPSGGGGIGVSSSSFSFSSAATYQTAGMAGASVLGVGLGAVTLILNPTQMGDGTMPDGYVLPDESGNFPTGNAVFSNRPRGFWDGKSGAAEWGRWQGIGRKAGIDKFHELKQNTKGSRGDDAYSTNPETGLVADQSGEIVGDLNDE